MTDALKPGQTIGILGGGQLGRMLAMAAARLGLQTHVYEPGANPPAAQVANRTTTAPYEDLDSLTAFAQSVDVVTYEFENVPADALDAIEAVVPIRPNRQALAVSQDRLTEKTFLTEIGLDCAPFAPVHDDATLAQAIALTGLPAILKTRRLGYDGKGQARIRETHDTTRALAEMQGAEAILEGMVAFDREISVIAARGADDTIACFEPGENVHKDGILHTTTVPADIDEALRERAFGVAGTILTALDYVGVMGVELFVVGDRLLVNEIAPRVHNSGHWTEAGAVIDQFEQHIRAVAGWPLVDPVRHSDVVMTNLIGDDVDDVAAIAAETGARLHLYGKAEARAGRKMGHVTRVLRPASDRV
ncbi:5-(carboxyamino)imidazole ribonucleotide synthase [Alphaproteobacteria bacterium GH1-50]|uniref:N5-carboxyaminoimidazole ribonucleotide synthase n=1 Tax=Kangsaoukella pontilimi TaxID=2691042 RepID=A0A7C9MWQ6_9RHOB|nr:5-(carboxyamino)imidazole ribonucleotide synthase [Kangsaoukella pontilimi]MXQ08540.1 5-(carboxyamino)imidazole ribonucleotide synthase [Kangsaoukella pontilimi]